MNTMLRLHCLPILAFLTTAPLHADEPAELAKLRTSYDGAILKAVTPINQTYQRELQRLKDTYTKAARLQDALAVDAALKAVSGLTPATVTGPVSAPKADAALKPDKKSAAYKSSTKIGDSHFAVIGMNLTFDAARDMATQLGGRLAVVTDEKLARRLLPIGVRTEAWIDAVRDNDTKVWKASDGTAIPTTLLSPEAAATANPTTNACLTKDGIIAPSAPNRAIPSIIEWK